MEKPDLLVIGPGGNETRLDTFDFQAWNHCGTFWETRIPGRDAEETWNSADHEHRSLEGAVRYMVPNFADHGLTLESAARLCLQLALVLGTGIDVPQGDPDEE